MSASGTCNGQGATHHFACECRERMLAAKAAKWRELADQMAEWMEDAIYNNPKTNLRKLQRALDLYIEAKRGDE